MTISCVPSCQKPRRVSASKQRRDFARCWANRRRSASLKDELETAKEFLTVVRGAINTALSLQHNPFVAYYKLLMMPGVSGQRSLRQRDLYPLPPVEEWPLQGFEVDCIPEALTMVNMCIAALNMLFADMSPAQQTRLARTPTKSQRAVHDHLAQRCARFLGCAASLSSNDEAMSWSFKCFEEKAASKYPAMKADCVDLPTVAATCDSSRLLPPELARSIMDPEGMFPADACQASEVSRPEGVQRDEYIKLVHRQLHCGKTKLRVQCKALGDVFCVAKSTPGKQREVWNGSAISHAAIRPPAPTKLANPSCFIDLCFQPDEAIYMSKRDVQTCFDVLLAPDHLQEWFGRPPVSLHELSRVCQLPQEAFLEFVIADDRENISSLCPLFPTSTVWPMGFSWSSCVAQACTVCCCLEAGVPDQAFMSLDASPPIGAEACGVATDDTFFFHRDKVAGAERLRRLDQAFARNGMPKNTSKDVTLQPAMTALGCELTSQPPAAEPAAAKLLQLFVALLDVCVQGKASPSGLSRALGVEQWFCLLNRPMFSIFDLVYEFVRREPQDDLQPLPEGVRTEILVAASLVPLLGADLGRAFLPQLIACDASSAHGFGVSYMPCSPQLVRDVSLLSERRGDFVRFFPDPDEPPRKDRMGTPHELPFHKWQFRTAISARARWQAHSGLLEAHGLLLALKWALRSARHFHQRLVVLVDAKAILGAASKGRTSAPGIRGILRKIGALLMGTNSLLRLVYIPSEDNPADAPSRGIVRRCKSKILKRSNRSRLGTPFLRHVNRLAASYEVLRKRWGDNL